MGQADILNFLEQHKTDKFTTKQLSEMLHMSTSNLSICCSKLRQNKEINFKVFFGSNNQRYYLYKYKK